MKSTEIGTAPGRSISIQVSRSELFAGLSLIGFTNGIIERVYDSIADHGLGAAAMNTFDISIIVWSALGVAISFFLKGGDQAPARADWIVVALTFFAILLPVGPLSWLALAGLSVYVIWRSPSSSYHQRGAWIVLALTVPMFWGRLAFAAFSDYILSIDATLAGWIIGTRRLGNAIAFADGSGYLWIAPACSSLANMSLAVLCWVTIAQLYNRPRSWRDIAWIAGACLSVVIINVTRISLLGMFRDQFDLIHGPIGATIVSWLILAVTVGICAKGVRNGAPSRP